MELLIDTSGNIRCIYGEKIDLHQFGQLSIQRGSHVEPTSDGLWTADMSPVNGPHLGPFHSRTEALKAKVAWLLKNWLTPTE